MDSLVKPRTAIIMVKAGEPTDAMINALADLMEPGDIIVDAGNAYFPDTIRREKEISARGLHFVGCGVSGGEEGALLGPSMMPGGSEESWKTLKPILNPSRPRPKANRASPISVSMVLATSSRWCTTVLSTPTCSSSLKATI